MCPSSDVVSGVQRILQARKLSSNMEGDTLSLVTSIKLHFLLFGDIVHVCVFTRPDLIHILNGNSSTQRLHVNLEATPQVHHKLPLRIAFEEPTPDVQYCNTERKRVVWDSELSIGPFSLIEVYHCIRFLDDASHPVENTML